MARSRSNAPTLAIVLLGATVGWYVLGRGGSTESPGSRPSGTVDGSATVERRSAEDAEGWSAPRLASAEVCGNVGYLCFALSDSPSIRVLRFSGDHGVLRVGVPEPEGLDAATARSLQSAAIRGIRAWDGHPFPIRIVQRNRGEETDFDFRWTRALEGRMLGESLAQLRTGPGGADYRSNGVVLVTHSPQHPERVRSTEEVELTAAHEMGHALGLPHSDDPRDLMYRENTATHPTSRDYRTLDALYRLPVGAEIRR